MKTTIYMVCYAESYGFNFWNRTSKPDIYKMTFESNELNDMKRLWE